MAPDIQQVRTLQAPSADRGILISPPADQVPALLAERTSSDVELLSRSLDELATQARQELLEAAVAYSRCYRDNLPVVPQPGVEAPPVPIILAGHQAELFHVGVWAKNFALHRFAAAHRAVPINLVVDSDVLKRSSLRIPGGTPAWPRFDWVPFDTTGPPCPAEERRVLESSLWQSFATRVQTQLAGLIPNPLVKQFWPLVMQRWKEGAKLGLALAQARHQWEAQWDLRTLELPLSATCQGEPFWWFVAHLLSDLPRFQGIYHTAIRRYRKINKLRSKRHPFPELETGSWLEAPFWVWSLQHPQRRRLFVQSAGGSMTLTDRQGWQVAFPWTSDMDGRLLVDRLTGLAQRGIKIRTRAVTTTLWARLFLGDLFIHGLGGAKYDQVTNEVIREFYGRPAPGYLTVTATARLPVPRSGIGPEDVARVRSVLRRLEWNPQDRLQHHQPVDPQDAQEAAHWMDIKEQWASTQRTRENARRRFRAIREANRFLEGYVARRKRLVADWEPIVQQVASEQTQLASRDYSFVLFPEEFLADFLRREIAEITIR